jgi:hypothetical protein
MAVNFWPWLLACFVLGAGVAAYPTYKVTRAVFERATLKAELKLSQLDSSLATERAETLRLGQELSTAVLENRDAQRNRLDAIAGDLSRVASGVQVCARKSDVRITVTPAGAIEATRDGELRNLADSIRDFAVACAIGRDRDATDHNALIDWLEKMRGRPAN